MMSFSPQPEVETTLQAFLCDSSCGLALKYHSVVKNPALTGLAAGAGLAFWFKVRNLIQTLVYLPSYLYAFNDAVKVS